MSLHCCTSESRRNLRYLSHGHSHSSWGQTTQGSHAVRTCALPDGKERHPSERVVVGKRVHRNCREVVRRKVGKMGASEANPAAVFAFHV
jgi:hypothetical protein